MSHENILLGGKELDWSFSVKIGVAEVLGINGRHRL
jgi:hypothetical protein